MVKFFFLGIIILSFFQEILTGDYNCVTDYLDCFNCSTCGEKEDRYIDCPCQWKPNNDPPKCETVSKEGDIGELLYKAFSQCIDTSSTIIQNKYCGTKSITVNDDFSFSMPFIDGLYGTRSLYCEYILNFSGDEDDYYNINYQLNTNSQNTMYIHLLILFENGDKTSGNLGIKLDKDFYNVKQVEIRMYFNNGFETLPFSFTITKKTDNSKLALYITIGVIIVACILCALAIYCLSKKISENARLRQRALFEVAMAHQEGERGVDDEAYEQQKLEEENKLKIKYALKHSLKPKKYLKKYGVKDSNTCTICIEDFKENKSKVSITPCKHVFHYQCLSNWLHKNVMNPKCPNCNNNLIKDVKDTDIANEKTVIKPERVNVVRRNRGEGETNSNNQNNEEVVIENLEPTRNRIINENTNTNQNTDERNLRTSNNNIVERRDNSEN